MKLLGIISASVLALVFASPANAQDVAVAPIGALSLSAPVSGITYFNRAGATLAGQRADLEACDVAVMAMEQPYQSSGAGAAYGLVGVLVETAISANAQRSAQRRARFPLYENCMVLRGWRVVRLDEALGQELDALDQPSLAARLGAMVGTENPEGEIARVFANEVADGATIVGGPPQAGDVMSLSLQALPTDSSAYIAPAPTRAERDAEELRSLRPQTREERAQQRAERQAAREEQGVRRETLERARLQLLGSGDAARPVRARDIAQLPENSTLLIVRVVGLGYGSSVLLMRPGAAENTVDFVTATVPTAFISGPKEETVVAIVPPGRWRLSGFIGSGGYVTSFCMGAPSFDIAEGEIVFAGSFGFSNFLNGSAGQRLDMGLDPARTVLGGAPSLAARVRPAEYENGETFECGAGSNFYSFEIPNAPVAESYRLGSRAHARTADALGAAGVSESAPTETLTEVQLEPTN